ncbi:MAG TPA: NrtA/SsuA/CpmA family ABC transporter substrate-binding protein [Polyangiaceae bacterium]|nr:NrtA/SsuA/CpmA family ABC transporter substrate-binding protein [Polyangiaceae bacterium]
MQTWRWAPVALCFLFLLGSASCRNSSAAEREQGLPSGSAGAGTAHDAIVIRFSDPGNSGVLAYAKRNGILEKELAKVNAKIEWVPAAGAFSANFEAMNSGAINASGGAISPIIGALSHHLDFKIFAIGDPSDAREAGIVSPAGSPLKKVEDLVGKRVAVNWAAHGDYLLLKALANHGISADKVSRVPIQPPDAAAAFATGKIDAWSTFGVFFETAIKNGANVIAYESQLDSDDVTVSAANAALLAKNPTAFQVLLKVEQDLSREAREHPERFQNLFTDKGPTAVSGDRLAISIRETQVTPTQRVPTAADKQRVANVAKIFFDNKSIDRAIGVDEIVFDIDAAAQAKAAK